MIAAAAACLLGLQLAVILVEAAAPSRPAEIPEGAWQPVTVPATPDLRPIVDPMPPATVGPVNRPQTVPTPKVIVVPVPTKAPPKAPRSPSVAEAKAWARATLGDTQYECLADIIRHEDGTWDPYRTNASSGAYGIPQALPGSKMATAGADWRSNRITQVRWMIGYVNARYGSACTAAAFRTSHGWY